MHAASSLSQEAGCSRRSWRRRQWRSQSRGFLGPRPFNGSECIASRHSSCSPLRSWEDHEGAPQEIGRSSTWSTRSSRRTSFRVRGGLSTGRRTRGRRSWRRRWICRGQHCGEGPARAHQDSWPPKKDQLEALLLEAKEALVVERGMRQRFVHWPNAWRRIPSTSTKWSSRTSKQTFSPDLCNRESLCLREQLFVDG